MIIQEDPFRSEDRLKSTMDKEAASIVFNAHLDGGKGLIACQISMGRYVFGFQAIDFKDPIYESAFYQALNIEIDDVDSMIYALKSLAKDETVRIEEAIIVESGKAAMDRAMKMIAESYCMNHLPSVNLSTSSDPMNWAHGDLAGPTGPPGTPGQQ